VEVLVKPDYLEVMDLSVKASIHLTGFDSASFLITGHLFLIIDIFLYLSLSSWSIWQRMV
jgi:hypothetical protein